MSSLPLARSRLDEALTALKADLIHEDGPRISTMRNYRFAIVPYDPHLEYELRERVQRLMFELKDSGWFVLSIDLHALFLRRLKAMEPDDLEWIIESERELAVHDSERSFNYLREELANLIEGPEGLATDCSEIIREHLLARPETADRTVALVGRAAGLYPFFRNSALLRHLDGHTEHVPVVLLYPGERRGDNGLSFMGMLEPDRDYRPRIYP